MTDQNFAIDITALQDDLYRITAKGQDGEWTVEVFSPFEKAELRDTLALLSSVDSEEMPAETQGRIRRFGQKLFDFLIGQHPDILTAYRSALERVSHYRLFIRISSDDAGRFIAIPWEYIHDPERGFLALSRQTPLVRWSPDLDPRPPAPLIYPLRALVVIPSPPNYPPVKVEAEWERLSSATADLRSSGHLLLERLESATWPALRRQLRAEDYQVVHYIGHSYFDEPTRQGYFALEDEHYASGSRPISANEMGNKIGSPSTIRLFILNSVSGDVKAPLSMSQQLLQTGLAAVLATPYRLSQQSSVTFNGTFYAPLCEAHPVEAALNVTRRAIVERTASADWGKLVLFLRAPYGRLFHLIG